MKPEEIARINALARKAKTPEGLTPAEKEEQGALRRRYIDSFKQAATQREQRRLTHLCLISKNRKLRTSPGWINACPTPTV